MNPSIKRRDFLKQGALAGFGALLGNSIVGRVTPRRENG
jgi:hypothetical protein